MISISGTVVGELDYVVCSPTQQRFLDVHGDPVVAATVYADVFVDRGRSAVQLNLADDQTMLSQVAWGWRIYEVTKDRVITDWIIPSQAASYNYADIRPVRGT